MIGYVCLGTNDLPKASAFYDALFSVIGAKRVWDLERFVGWGQSESSPLLLLIKPINDAPATVGNGTMVALAARSRAEVDAVYHQAMALGATDEGPLGDRGENFYVGYFRDPEGHKLAVYFAG
jgi:predicted lactoylglutathione lyase